jgi:hypothetical protein
LTIECIITETDGFKCSDRFVITGSLVYGTVRGLAAIDLMASAG